MNVRPEALPFSVVREREAYRLRLWGRFSAEFQGADVRPRGRKARALLAFLALRGSDPLERGRAGALLWSERGDEQASASLRQCLLELRDLSREPHPLLKVDRHHIALDGAMLETDLDQIERFAEAGNAAGLVDLIDGRAMRLLDDLDSIDSAFDEWLANERAVRHEWLRRTAMATAERALAAGDVHAAIALAARLAEIDPLDESIARLEMNAHAAGADRDAVRRRYRRLEATLAAELGTRPHPETTNTFARLTGAPAVQSVPEPSAREDDRAEPAGDRAPDRAPPPPPRVSRRWMIGAAAAALVGTTGAGALWWRSSSGHVPNSDARRFYDKGMQAQYFALDGTSEQAETYFRRAAEADPEWADAWGSLAMSYRHMMDGETNVAQWRLVEQTRSAAQRALALDPGNAEALVALALIDSPFRRWAETENRYRSLLARVPAAFVLRGHLGRLLRDVGRFDEASNLARLAAREQPMIPLPAISLITSLWGAGRLHEAESTLDAAFRTWPRHPIMWFTRINFLTFTGRGAAAVAMAEDVEGRPAGVGEAAASHRLLRARAMHTRTPDDIEAASAALLALMNRAPGMQTQAFPFYAALGLADQALAVADSYFFGRGPLAPAEPRAAGPLTRWDTSILFMPYVAPLWRDARFGSLLGELGLEEYWRTTGLQPDYRRARAG